MTLSLPSSTRENKAAPVVVAGVPRAPASAPGAAPLLAQAVTPKKAEPPAPVVRLSTPMQALEAARADLAQCLADGTLVEDELFLIRYVWVQSGEGEDVQALSFALNLATRGSVPFLSPQDANGLLVRLDLRYLMATEDDFDVILALWEKFGFDPSFAKLLHGDTLRFLDHDTLVPQLWRWYGKVGEKRVVTKRELGHVKLSEFKDLVVVRLNPTLLEPMLSELQQRLVTLAPVVESRYLTGRILSTIKDEDEVKGKKVANLFSVVWGGLYYEFAGVRKSQTKGVTDLQQLLIDMGIGSKDESFEKLFERLRSDERLALYRSGVTGKPRRVVWFGTPNSRLSVANGVCFITEDVRNRDVRRGDDPTANLVNFTPRAYEVIWTRRNGMLGYAIYGEDQQLLEKAAPDVVTDHTIPAPNTSELQGAIGCLRCHGPHDGWQPLRNEVKELVPLVVGDLSKVKSLAERRAAADLADRLRGWYQGDAKEPLFIARLQNARVTLRSTGRWRGEDNAKVNQLASARVAQVFAQDRYVAIDAVEASRRLGLAPTVEAFNAAMTVPVNTLDDATLRGLQNGYKVTAFQWALSYQFALERACRK